MKKNTAAKTSKNAKELINALKESTEKSLKDLMNEAISEMIQEDDEEEEEKDPEVEDAENDDEESYEVEDVETEDDTESDEEADDEADEEGLEDEDDEEWSDMEEFKVGDNDYDFTGVDGETALRVYNKLNDDDQIFVKKDEEGDLDVEDDETGADYVIELNADDEDEANEGDGEFEIELDSEEEPSDEAEFELELGDDEESEPEEAEFELELGDDDSEDEDDFDIEIDDEESDDEDALNEDKNEVVNDYQKDVMPNLNMNEPANPKATRTWGDNAKPKDNSRPYAKSKGNSTPFEQQVNECGNMPEADLNENGQGSNTKRSRKKTTNNINKDLQGQHNVSDHGEYQAIKEQARKIYEKAKEIQAENKQLHECINSMKKSIYEAATLNVNMGQIIKLLVNETTTKNEKKSILERFNKVKTIKEGAMLYEAIQNELHKSDKGAMMLEQQISAKSSNSLNETTIYKSNPSLDLMNRMENLYK